MTQNIIGGMLLAIIGLMLVINPHGVWKFTERWKHIGCAEMSPAFGITARTVGAFCLIIGLLVAVGLVK